MSISEKEAKTIIFTPLDKLKKANQLIHDYIENMTRLSNKMDEIIHDLEFYIENIKKEKIL